MGKAEERALALAARRGLSPAARQAASEAICRRLLTMPELGEAGLILSYLAAWDEADLAPLHRALRAQGKLLAFPVSGPAGRMEAWIPTGPEQLRRGAFGLREPDPALARPARPEELDLVLVPCVAFDAGLRRLGHGAGYYDRYLPRCREIPLLVPAFEVQRLPRVTAEAHDRTVDAVITERGIYRKKN